MKWTGDMIQLKSIVQYNYVYEFIALKKTEFKNKFVPKKHMNERTTESIVKDAAPSTSNTHKYPNGVFESNGNLKIQNSNPVNKFD